MFRVGNIRYSLRREVLARALGREPIGDVARKRACGTPGCYNPACSQEGGVQVENVMREGHYPRGKPQLSLSQVREMRALRAQGHSYPALAERFGVWKSTAWAAVNRQTFAEVQA